MVNDLVIKKEYQKRGMVHWHMLVWVEEGTAPEHAVMAEMPRGPDTDDKTASYLRQLVGDMLVHKQCYASRCFKGSHGKTLTNCEYGFPFKVVRGWMMRRCGICTNALSRKIPWLCHTIQRLQYCGEPVTMCREYPSMGLNSTWLNTSANLSPAARECFRAPVLPPYSDNRVCRVPRRTHGVPPEPDVQAGDFLAF